MKKWKKLLFVKKKHWTMTTYKSIVSLSLAALFSMQILAQEVPSVLMIDDAVNLALEYNFDIRVSKKNAEISRNNVTIGNAGYLPKVSLDGNYNYSLANTKTNFENPALPTIDANGAATKSYGAGLNVNYNIYSGGQRSYTYKSLQNAERQSTLQEKQMMELTVVNVIQQYLEAVNFFDAYQISQESVKISQDRFIRAGERYSFGGFSKLELLNAEVDLSNDSTNMIQAMLAYEKARKNLSNIIGIEPNSEYSLSSEFEYSEELVVDELLEKALSGNTEYLLAKSSVTESELNLKQTKATMLPRLDLIGGYDFNKSTFDANFIESNRSLGWNAGLTFSYDLFDGGNRKRDQQNARMQMESQQYNLQKSENDLNTRILNRYEDYTTNLKLLDLSERNLLLAENNYERSQEAFSIGQITGIELREAQLNLANAKYNISVRRIQTKQAEVSLYSYSGTLVN